MPTIVIWVRPTALRGIMRKQSKASHKPLNLGGSSFYSYRGMGLAYNGLEEYEKAIESFQQAIEAAGYRQLCHMMWLDIAQKQK